MSIVKRSFINSLVGLTLFFAFIPANNLMAQQPLSQTKTYSTSWAISQQATSWKGLWTLNNPNKIIGNGGTAGTRYLTINNLGFSIPPNSIITGVKVIFMRYVDKAGRIVADASCKLSVGNSLSYQSADKANHNTHWPNGASNATLATYGGPNDTWAHPPGYIYAPNYHLTPATVNSSAFGLLFAIVSPGYQTKVDGSTILKDNNFTFTVYYKPSTPLPIKLNHFTATSQNCSVTLQWKVSSEEDNAYFDIERSSDGRQFNPIGKVKGQGSGHFGAKQYTFTDKQPVHGDNFYRLRQYDMSQISHVTKIVRINVACRRADVKVFPNPTDGLLQVSGMHGLCTIYVYNELGQVVLQQSLHSDNSDMDISSLLSGFYFVRIRNDKNETIVNKKVLKQ